MFFFFSSRRRHTRSLRDWSSDVCSSDLGPRAGSAARGESLRPARGHERHEGGVDGVPGEARAEIRRSVTPRARLAVHAACGLWLAASCLAASCLTERPRPAPPTIAITLDKTTVQSRNAPAPPDTLTVTVRAADPDGIDSAWVQLDGDPPLGADGL